MTRWLLGYQEARASPCAGCAAYCCRYLALPEFRVDDFDDLDWAVYLLNFDGVALTITSNGRWMAYWHASCRHLDEEHDLCRVHGTDEQPHTCVRYDPFHCHYRTVFASGEDEQQLWVDRRRMALLLPSVQVDELRRRVALPPFEVLRRAFEALPYDPHGGPAPAPAPAATGPAGPAGPAGTPGVPVRFGDRRVQQPCESCAAYCCQRLEVPLETPRDATLLDYLRYALGFPAVELVVGEAGWRLALPTTCRHLAGGRCAVFGQVERPTRCEFYDAWTCTYRDTYAPGGAGELRFDYETLPALLACCELDERGQLLGEPAPEAPAAAAGRRPPPG